MISFCLCVAIFLCYFRDSAFQKYLLFVSKVLSLSKPFRSFYWSNGIVSPHPLKVWLTINGPGYFPIRKLGK